MFHIVVCDDDIRIANHIKELLDENFGQEIECNCLYNAEDLHHWIYKTDASNTNILILDIALGDADGITIAKQIRDDYPQIKVILLSGYAQLASSVFDADPVYFLSKPVVPQKLFSSVEKAMEIVENQQVKMITLSGTGGKIHRINTEEIIYIETYNRNCMLYRDKGEPLEIVSKLSDIMAVMPEYIIFTHQSFACNIFKVRLFSKEDGIVVSDGSRIPVSRRHYKDVKEKIALHI